MTNAPFAEGDGGAVSSTSDGQGEPRSPSRWLWLGLPAVMGLIAGYYGSIFGPFYILIAGVVTTAVGGIALGNRRGRTWPRVVLVIGIAVVIGASAYILVGLLTPQGSGSGSGGGCMPGGTCRP